MLAYYINLLVRAFLAIPTSLGSNMLGLLWPMVVVLVGEVIACFAYGWKLVYREKLKQFSLIGFAALGVCYTLLFVWCAFRTNYIDVAELSSKAGKYQHEYEGSAEHEKFAVLQAQSKCSELVGADRVLGQQNRDQQNTINNVDPNNSNAH